jgi:transposase InsO family protein
MNDEERRQVAMERFEHGEAPEAIWCSLGRSRRWFHKWLARFRTGEAEWFRDQSRGHPGAGRTPSELEAEVKRLRAQLEEEGLCHGAQALQWALEDAGYTPLPAVRTLARIVARQGLVTRRKGRYQPKGTPYPAPAADRPGAVCQADLVGPGHLRGAGRFYSLNAVDLATGRCAVEPVRTKAEAVAALWAVWRRLGLPRYQQVDNESVFYGSSLYPRSPGRLVRLALPVGVEPVFIPVGEPWRNGVVEKFNDHYRDKLLARVPLADWEALRRESLAFEHKHNSRHHYTKLGGKTPLAALAASQAALRFPPGAEPPAEPWPVPTAGCYHAIRLIRSDAKLHLFGEPFALPKEAVYEYVWATVEVARQELRVYLHGELLERREYRLRA